jgi:hypothetical protein
MRGEATIAPPNGGHSQATFGWLAAGWEVDSVDLHGQNVTFRKARR